jgi:hypothetical protein
MWIDEQGVESEARGAAAPLNASIGANSGVANPSSVSADRHAPRSTTHAALQVVRRAAYWLPVFAPMVIFAQVALLGLRPALCERTRLEQAELALRERYERDAAQHEVIRANLRARQDPIFLERQRRWLCVAEPAR